MLRLIFVPTSSNRSFQKELVKLLSQSLIIVLGKPCSLNTSLKNNAANSLDDIVEVTVKKCANLVNLSTTTYVLSFPLTFGSLVMKTMETLSHFGSGIGIGWRSPVGWCAPLCYDGMQYTPSHALEHIL